MSLFYSKQMPGEVWMRDLNNNVSPASNVLSSIYLKYQDINSSFYSELTSNNILRFDLFYDTFFVETHTGYVFEKFYVEDNRIIPYNQINLFNRKKTTSLDYWFDEKKNKIYYGEIYCYDDEYKDPLTKYFEFVLIFKSFDCNTGLSKVLILDQITIAWDTEIDWDINKFYIENPKITYNADTKNFNVSFILRNSVYSFGLVSVNVLNSDTPYITEVNGFLPYFTINTAGCYISAIKDLPDPTQYGFLKTELDFILSTESSEFITYNY